ncbi:MAG TPA: MAPEG family protein [Candidatus Binataceae bacterium]|nr:MAPEG family protein [Candidatus Binataceae bacterium]
MSNEQKKVMAGIVSAIVFCTAFFEVAFRAASIDLAPPGGIDAAWRLSYAIRWESISALCLFAGVGLVANRRFVIPEAIAGDAVPAVEIDRRYVQNTLEQLMLAFVVHLAMATILPDNELRVIPILVALFVIGRVAFWIGYHIAPTARAFGFATTFYPTIVAYVYVVSRVLLG